VAATVQLNPVIRFWNRVVAFARYVSIHVADATSPGTSNSGFSEVFFKSVMAGNETCTGQFSDPDKVLL
jgi:hypothetical protein